MKEGTTFPDTIPEEFWKVIEEAQQDPNRFRAMLKTLNRGKIVRFYWTYEELANRLRMERYWPHVHPDLSEDGLAELANWVVAQGREHYCNILDRPGLIPKKKNDPGFMSELVEEYEERYNSDLPINTHEWDDQWKEHGKQSPWA